ncbi:hypothetical protein, partial [uncultured Clostridium sp.]|uniref:hypothetical protein n=1 Tax=uncultured Clostridium sp. TaxID=59620 RepID=UPI0025EB86F6
MIITSYKLEENDYNYVLEERITSFVISLCNDFVNKNHNISLLINNGKNMSFDIYNNFDIGNLLEFSLV